MSVTAVGMAKEIAVAMGIPADVPMTGEQVEEFKAGFARRMYVSLATHIAGPEVQVGSHLRQRCA